MLINNKIIYMDNIYDIQYCFTYEEMLKLKDIYKTFFDKKVYVCITKNNIKYEFLFKLKNTDKIIFIGNSMLDYEKKKEYFGIPDFRRHSWEFDYDVILFNDPTRYMYDIHAGWGVGNSDVWCLKDISIIINDITNILNIEKNNVILYGSSQGGFFSIMISALLGYGISVSTNPQINIDLFDTYDKYIRNEIFKKYANIQYDKIKTNVIDLFNELNYVPNCIIYFGNDYRDVKQNQYITNNISNDKIKIHHHASNHHGEVFTNNELNNIIKSINENI